MISFFALPLGLMSFLPGPVKAAPSASPRYVANSTITSLSGTSGYLTTGTQASASMCPVQQNGLAPIGDGPPEPAYYYTACSCNAIVSSVVTNGLTTVTGMNSDGSLWSETATVKTVTDPTYTPPQDCCVQCLVSAKDVQILYWPIETATSTNNILTANNMSAVVTPSTTAAPPSYSFVSNGITLKSISPSVYVAYRSLGAPLNCPAFGADYFPSGNVYNTTIAYPPDALSTSMCDGLAAGFQIYTAINYTELQFPTGAQTSGTCEWRIGQNGTSARGPYLSIPSNVLSVDPAWSTCTGAFEGSFDPPSALHKAPNLVAPSPTPPPSPPPAPSPGAVAPGNAQPTTTPANQDPKSEPSPSPVNPQGPAKQGSGQPSPSPPSDPNNINSVGPGAQDPPIEPNNGQEPPNPSLISNPPKTQPVGGNGPANPGPQSGNNPPPNSVVANGNTIVRDPGGGVVVAGSTYMPGQSTSISGNTPLSIGPDNVVVAGSSYALPPIPPTTSAPIPAQSIVRAPDGGIVVGTTSIGPGAQASVSGHIISAGPSAAVVDGSTYALPASAGAIVQAPAAPPATTPLLVAGNSIVKGSNGGIIIGTSTLAPGQQATLAGHIVSNGPSAAIVDGTTYTLPPSAGVVVQAPATLQTPTPLLIAGNSIIKGPNGDIIIGTSTLLPGQQATISNHIISDGPSNAILDGTTYPLPATPGSPILQTPPPNLITALASPLTLANNQILIPGGSPATVSSTTLSLPATPNTNAAIIINGATQFLQPTSVFTLANGLTFTANPTSFLIGDQTLIENGTAVTEGGTILSLGTAGLVFGAGAGQTTVPVTPAEASADAAALGNLIGGNGARVTGGGNGSASSGPVVFTGEACGWMRGRMGMGMAVILTGLHIPLMAMELG
ncbi:hypothetical protein JMJ35_006440 [Cladonia borealis]|uniref:Uncharacterized protein n=1 Tax=Cladonia borealis TaxID=184061 RepID=A0AA39QX89_9LECA|nr:hypothetical protein JMJ35_006440 [Cladonia borealis]